jgi:hypothetical protein
VRYIFTSGSFPYAILVPEIGPERGSK